MGELKLLFYYGVVSVSWIGILNLTRSELKNYEKNSRQDLME